MRLFIAFEPPEETVQELIQWQQANLPPNCRPEPASNLHLTLAFLGETPDHLVEPIGRILNEIVHSNVVLTGAIEYRELAKLGMLVYQEEGGTEIVERVNQELDALMGFKSQFPGPWLAHTTMWRFKPEDKPDLNPPLPQVSFSPVGVHLYQSVNGVFTKVASAHKVIEYSDTGPEEETPWDNMRRPIIHVHNDNQTYVGPPGTHHAPLLNTIRDSSDPEIYNRDDVELGFIIDREHGEPEERETRRPGVHSWGRGIPQKVKEDLFARYGNRISNIYDVIHKELDQDVYLGIKPRGPIVTFIQKTFYAGLQEHFGITDPSWFVTDFVLTGSLTTYQYNETSDCDISVFLDFEAFMFNFNWDAKTTRTNMVEFTTTYLDGTFLPGTVHPLQYFMLPEGTKVEDRFAPGMRSGWSFDQKGWIVRPDKSLAHNIKSDMPDLYAKAVAMADKLTLLLDGHKIEAARDLFAQIHAKRGLDQQAGLGDFSEGNVVYKYLLHEGLFSRLTNEAGIVIHTNWDQDLMYQRFNAKGTEDHMSAPPFLYDPETGALLVGKGGNDTHSTLARDNGTTIRDFGDDPIAGRIWTDPMEYGDHILTYRNRTDEIPDDVRKRIEDESGWSRREAHGQELVEIRWLFDRETQTVYACHADDVGFDNDGGFVHPFLLQEILGKDWTDIDPQDLDARFELGYAYYYPDGNVEFDKRSYDFSDHAKGLQLSPEEEEKVKAKIREVASQVKTAADKEITVVYNFENDRILLGTNSAVPSGSILIGSYDGHSVKLNQSANQWMNANYFKRLWLASYPTRPLTDVHMEGEHLPTRHHDEMTYTQQNGKPKMSKDPGYVQPFLDNLYPNEQHDAGGDCPNPLCDHQFTDEDMDNIDLHRGWFTCPQCGESYNVKQQTFESGGKTRAAGLSAKQMGDIGETIIERLGFIPHVGDVTWHSPDYNNPIDFIIGDYAVELKTNHSEAQPRFKLGGYGEKVKKQEWADERGLTAGIMGVRLNFYTSKADIFFRPALIDTWIGAPAMQYCGTVDFRDLNPYPDPTQVPTRKDLPSDSDTDADIPF